MGTMHGKVILQTDRPLSIAPFLLTLDALATFDFWHP